MVYGYLCINDTGVFVISFCSYFYSFKRQRSEYNL